MSARRFGGAIVALTLAGALWLPNVHLLYARDVDAYTTSSGIAPRARSLLAGQLAAWRSEQSRAARIDAMRATNPEWDFMARTFFALALADASLRSPSEERELLGVLDGLILETIALEASAGQEAFLLPYAHARPFRAESGRSLFVDGEIAIMLAARQMVAPRADFAPLLRERARLVAKQMSDGPIKSGESYPDECWTFCNTTALAALRMYDVVEGESHEGLFADWLAFARRRLVDRETGLLVSSYSYTGEVKDGPEGSSLWMSARNLLLVDEAFAFDQYARARRELSGSVLGFAYAREWPRRRGSADVDSGPIVPFLDASAGSSGLALLGASAFGDRPLLDGLLASLEATAFPEEGDGALRFAAGNAVGDAVLLASVVSGPLWDRVRAARRVSFREVGR